MRRHGQMSEAMPTGIFLTLSGGFQDAYTYYTRGKVFANAQTGNIILLGHNEMNGDFTDAFRYLAPVLAFAGGIYISEVIRGIYREYGKLHWRQIVVALEILLLFVVGFLPQSMNMAANILVSFVCAMQVEAFRKMKGCAYASTMCIGNLRSATEMLYRYRHTKEKGCLEKCLRYYGVILVFGIGAALGSLMTSLFKERTIWISCGFLFVCFCIMFMKEDIEGERGLD
ncbi:MULTISPECIES: YoaK family protein [Hungatella]|uniref:YoaK family protein n=1 Tax=Hungatella TaxID=1649459 RepID=UPI001FAA68F6|nr:YoaK family protein [Hungatella hathewayi]